MDILNYIVLITGLIIVGIFWNVISSKERKKETRIVTSCLFVLSVVVYFLQSSIWPH